MTRRILVAAIAAAACAVALTAGAAHASDGGRTTLVLDLKPNLVEVSCPPGQFGFGLDAASLAGRPLGMARSCIRSTVGCDPFDDSFVPFCRRTVRATLTLDLERGSLTVPIKLLEILPTRMSFIQAGSGTVSSGTGAYASATGRLAGGGAGAFDDEFNFTGRLVYVAELRGVR